MIPLFLAIFVMHGTAVQQTVFHPAQYEGDDIFPAQTAYNRGHWERITGPAIWLVLRKCLWYDKPSGIWEVQEGSPTAWDWTPLRDGDTLTLYEDGYLAVSITHPTNQ